MRLTGGETVNAALDTVITPDFGSGKSLSKIASLANGSGVPLSSYLWQNSVLIVADVAELRLTASIVRSHGRHVSRIYQKRCQLRESFRMLRLSKWDHFCHGCQDRGLGH